MSFDLNKYINYNLLEKSCRKGSSIPVSNENGENPYFSFSVCSLKEKYGDRIEASLHLFGSLMLEFGIRSQRRAYRWFGEKKFSDKEERTELFEINLADFDSGTLEIFVRPLTTAASLFCHADSACENMIVPDSILYEFLSPSYELCSEESLYYRFPEGDTGVCYSYEEKCVHIAAGSSVDLVTYYNAFSSCKWKKYTNVDTISLFLDFDGAALAQLVHVTGQEESVLASWTLDTANRTALVLPAGRYPDSGIMGLRIYARKDCILYGGGYLADAPQTQAVRLGIGITTYHREDEVIPSVTRLVRAIKEHPLYHNAIDVTVVDNGQTLSTDNLPGATLIPNVNLGGSGGFMRSLIHYQDDGDYTHCLFMDDDAGCEPGCIFRSVSFLSHVHDKSIAIAGAMLLDTEPSFQWEKGAYFDAYCHSLNRVYNLGEIHSLISSETDDGRHKPYGGWWFFMFPLKNVEMFVFPYFVRGDDIEFSYLNNFNIVTMNGICSLQSDFRRKESPPVFYFAFRSFLLLSFVLNNIRCSTLICLLFLWKCFLHFNLSYHYDSANAITLILKNISKGLDFLINDINTVEIRNYLHKKYTIEVFKSVDIEKKSLIRKEKSSFIKNIIILITLNGHLLPLSVFDKNNYYIDLLERNRLDNMFLKKTVTVYDDVNKVGYQINRNCYYFFKNLLSMIFYTSIFVLKYPFIKKGFCSFYKKLKNGAFWRSLYKQSQA